MQAKPKRQQNAPPLPASNLVPPLGISNHPHTDILSFQAKTY